MASAAPENALDVAGGNPIDLGDLGNRHAVFRQSADAGKLRARNLTRQRRGYNRTFGFLTCRRGRNYSQHARLADRLVGWRRVGTWWRADRWFRFEQGFGRLARSGDPLAIITARMRFLVSGKQGLLPEG
jgi:hypothetical protein